MRVDRRTWLKQTSLGLAALGLAPVTGIAAAPDYIPGDSMPKADAPIRLSSNENPYGPSPKAKKAMGEYLMRSNRYNWPLDAELAAALAKKHGLEPANVLLGAGSTELLDLIVKWAAPQKGSFVTAHPSYPYWADTAERLGLDKISVPLDGNKNIDLPAMRRAIRMHSRLIYICNPNNPTGTLCDRKALESFVAEAAAKTLVVVDEAYLDFTDQPSLADLVGKYKNLVVVKTFSKIYGLAGARIGYALAQPGTLEQISAAQSWPGSSISVVSAAAALASLDDEAFLTKTRMSIQEAKTFTVQQLQALHLPCIPSSANFIYFSLEYYKKDFFEQLKMHKIEGTRIYEAVGNWTRITVGKMEEMKRLVQALGG